MPEQLPRRQRGPRKPSLASLLKDADKAGKKVKGAVVEAGRTTLTFGEPDPLGQSNPWLQEPKRTKP